MRIDSFRRLIGSSVNVYAMAIAFFVCIAIPQNLGAQNINPFAGLNTRTSDSGDGAAATAAGFAAVDLIVSDPMGNVYIGETLSGCVRKVTLDGNIHTYAGICGTSGWNGDGLVATSTEFDGISQIALDFNGNLYIADTNNERIRRVDASTLQVTTVAGNGTAGYTGDGSAAASAELDHPFGVVVDFTTGDLYIADTDNHAIRKVTASSGNISTYAGGNGAGFFGNGGAATSAKLNYPHGLALVFSSGTLTTLYIADTDNFMVRLVDVSSGHIGTYAGTTTQGTTGDGGAATSAELMNPWSLAIDGGGTLYIADQEAKIRAVNPSSGVISTVVGTGTAGYSGDGGAATSAQVDFPNGIAVDCEGNLYVGDSGNNMVREVAGGAASCTTYYPDSGATNCLAFPPRSTVSNPNGPTMGATATLSSPTSGPRATVAECTWSFTNSGNTPNYPMHLYYTYDLTFFDASDSMGQITSYSFFYSGAGPSDNVSTTVQVDTIPPTTAFSSITVSASVRAGLTFGDSVTAHVTNIFMR